MPVIVFVSRGVPMDQQCPASLTRHCRGDDSLLTSLLAQWWEAFCHDYNHIMVELFTLVQIQRSACIFGMVVGALLTVWGGVALAYNQRHGTTGGGAGFLIVGVLLFVTCGCTSCLALPCPNDPPRPWKCYKRCVMNTTKRVHI